MNIDKSNFEIIKETLPEGFWIYEFDGRKIFQGLDSSGNLRSTFIWIVGKGNYPESGSFGIQGLHKEGNSIWFVIEVNYREIIDFGRNQQLELFALKTRQAILEIENLARN